MAEHDRLTTAKDDEIADLKRQLEALRLQQRGRGETTLAARTAGRDGSRLSIMDGSRRQENLSPPRDSPSPVTDGHTPRTANVSTAPASVHTGPVDRIARTRQGKAPPVDPFTGEDPGVQLDDWLPALERASEWNGWSAGDLLLQFAGHLRGRALQEWNLIDSAEKQTYSDAREALRLRLDPGTKTLAAQEFRHSLQGISAIGEDLSHCIWPGEIEARN